MLHGKSTYAFFFLVFLLFSITTNATTYYLSSSSGNDSNNGTDPSTPWKTIDKLNSFHYFQAGDNILFKRGDTFYGSIAISNSGTGGSPIIYGAYGSGAKPIITGFTKVSSWNNLGGNIWESSSAVSSLPTLNMVVINGVNTPMGRYPNASTSYPFLPNFFYFQSHTGSGSGNTSITSSSLTSGTNWAGADVVVRVNHWTLDKERITGQSGNTLNYFGRSSGIVDNWGFFIQNDPRTLDVQNEWYYNPSTHKIRIYSSASPSNVLVTTVDTLFRSISKKYITVENLDLQGANTTGICLRDGNGATVSNCNISYTGERGLDLNEQDYVSTTDVENSYFTNCGSSAIFISGGANHIVKNNTVVGAGVISVIEADEYTNSAIYLANRCDNSLIQYNKVDSSGYNGIQFSGTAIQCLNNFVNYSNIVRDDGAGIYTGNAAETGKVIDGNIVLNSVGNINGIPVNDGTPSSSGIYIDDLGANIRITNNTIANCSSAGLFLHTTSNIFAYNNTCYNNGGAAYTRGGLFVQANLNSQITGNIVKNNIFFAKNPIQFSVFYSSHYSYNDVQMFGTLDSNYYAKPIDASATLLSNPSNDSYTNMDLAQWQSYSGKDIHSKIAPKLINSVDDLRFEYNPTTQSKTIALDANYIDVKGNNYNGSITLPPYSSAVLIRNGSATSNLLPAVNASNTVNGLDYKYYEAGNYSVVPDFSTISPVKTGNTNNFDISVASRTDNFAINFTGYINIPSDGQYTFYLSSDDGTLLYIDGIQVVNNDGTHAFIQQSNGIGLKAGLHSISVGYFNATGDKGLQVSYSGPGIAKQLIPSSALYRMSNLLPAVNASNTVNGLDYKYYEAGNYSVVPDFSTISPVKTGNTNNFDISVASRTDNFAINFTGYINIPSDGQYTFYLSSDDGTLLYIDGIQVVNNDGTHAFIQQSNGIGLKAGLHSISVGYFNATGDKGLQVSYSGPGIAKQLIPSSALYRMSNLLPAVNASNTVNGLDYKYYEAGNYSVVPDFSTISPVKTGNTNNFDISVASRTDNFAINFTGYINIPSDGQYTFYLSSDDGTLLYIDGIQVVNNDGTHAFIQQSNGIGLKAGLHSISVGYFNATGDKGLQVSYSGPGIAKQLIPSSALYRMSNLLPAVNASNTVNGLDYKYYEAGNYSVVPDFSTISPVKTGNTNNFDISVASRTDNFAINFTGYINIPSDGQYTFYLSSDDGTLLYIDGIQVVNNDGTHAFIQQSNGIGLKAGLHSISVGYFNATGDKGLQVSYSGPGIAKQLIPSSALYRMSNLLPAVNASNTVNGLDYKYYEAGNYSVVPDFSTISPVKTGNTNNFDISVASRTDNFAINFTGYINIPSDGQYTFYLSSDDGTLLYIDGIQVVNNDGTHAFIQQSNGIGLKAGLHSISVGYFNATGDKGLQVSYSGPGIAKQLIPSSALYTTSTLINQAVMVSPSSAMMFANDSMNFQMQRLLGNQVTLGAKVYPNPFRNSIQIDVNGVSASKFKLVLTDASGKVVWTKNVENYSSSYHKSVNTSALPIGIYFLRLIQNNKSTVTKLLKEY